MPTPYDGPERRMYDAANRRRSLDTISAAVRIIVPIADAGTRAELIAIIRQNAHHDDAAIVERMIADALCARVAPITPKEPT
jgi:hypothetical protein